MTDPELEARAEAACEVIARVEGWTSAPVKEAVYKAGYLAGALAERERLRGVVHVFDQAAKVSAENTALAEENARLRAQIDTMNWSFCKATELKERYRSTLENIASDKWCQNTQMKYADISVADLAREALGKGE